MGKITPAILLFISLSCKFSPVFAGSASASLHTPGPVDTAAPADTARPKLARPKLVYVVEGTPYLIPYIERKLKNLRLPESDSLLYDSVASLNLLTATTSIKATVIDILRVTYAQNFVDSVTAKRDSARLSYSGLLKNYQSVLAIKVTPLQDLIEFQFILYEVRDSGNTLLYRNSSSIFIDPRSSHYQADVNRGLDQVFEKANQAPRTNLTANFKKVNDTFFMTTEDTLLLQPIIDDESVEADRIYFWSENPTDRPQLPVQHSRKDLVLNNLPPGRYQLTFSVSNGINYSVPDTVRIYVYQKPRLRVQQIDGLFIRALQHRLIIQQYVFASRVYEYFPDYIAGLDTAFPVGRSPDVWVKISDKNGAVYAMRSFPIRHIDTNPHRFHPIDTAQFTGSEIIGNIDTLSTPIKTVKNNKYSISFVARNPEMESKQIKEDLNVYQHWPISLLYDVMIFPSDKHGLYHSWINAGIGVDIRLNKFLSGIAIFGTDLAQASFRHFYTDLIANFGPVNTFPSPFDKLEGGPALLINHDDGSQATGLRIAYTFYSGGHTNLKIGGSYYNLNHSNYFAIRFTGDIFFNH